MHGMDFFGGDVPTPSKSSDSSDSYASFKSSESSEDDVEIPSSLFNPMPKDPSKELSLIKNPTIPPVLSHQNPVQNIVTIPEQPITKDLALSIFKKNTPKQKTFEEIKKIDFSKAIASSKPIISREIADIKSSLPEYSPSDLLAETLIKINKAAIINSENVLWQAIKDFKSKKDYKIFDIELLRTKNSDELKADIFNRYIFNLLRTNQTSNTITAEICTAIPSFLNTIYVSQELSDDNSAELTYRTRADLKAILQYLKGQDTSLDNNLQLIEEIVTTTILTKNSIKICLLLLNKAGNFYPEIKSEIAQTIIDNITAYYFTLSAQLPSNWNNNELMAQTIQLLAIVPQLEPLFSKTLPISNIADEDLEDYLEKIILLKLINNSSKLVQDTLENMSYDIQKESDERLRQAAIAKQKKGETPIEQDAQETLESIIETPVSQAPTDALVPQTLTLEQSLEHTTKPMAENTGSTPILSNPDLDKEVNDWIANTEMPLAEAKLHQLMAKTNSTDNKDILEQDKKNLKKAFNDYTQKEPNKDKKRS